MSPPLAPPAERTRPRRAAPSSWRREEVARALAVLALLVGLAGALGFGVACSYPLDFNGVEPMAPGGTVDELLQQSQLSFTAHALAGSLLGAARCNGGAVGLQWLKAAWHAGGAADEARAGAGLRQAVALEGSPEALQAVLCAYFPNGVLPNQQRALRMAGMSCPAMRRA